MLNPPQFIKIHFIELWGNNYCFEEETHGEKSNFASDGGRYRRRGLHT
jgi:hypothetical protein